ncbi:hypothetical protein HK102_013213 [Quaeritorhiza haematococci]|nr:hypothetical protein HK102_013213 [Quaeritorhiza haematococci]
MFQKLLVFTTFQNVVVVGGGPSGIDIAREVCKYAQNTVISLKDPNAIGDIGESVESLDLTAVVAIATSGQTTQTLLPSSSKRISKKPEITKLHKDGSVEFADGSVVPDVDVIILCTGYL